MNLLSSVRKLYLASQPKPWKLTKPRVIQFPVNDICNSRCQMCNIWQRKLDYQITPDDLAKILQSPLFSEVRAVGVNGGEPTLRKDLSEIVEVLFRYLPNLSNISFITNAFQSKTVIQRLTEVGEVIKQYNGYLDVMVSLDGVGEIHDKVRGKKGNFERAVEVVDFIQGSELIHNTRLGCTVIKENIYGIHDLLEFALSKDIYIKYRLGIPHQRLYSEMTVAPFSLSYEEKYHFAIFLENLIKYYEKSAYQKHFYRSLIGQLMYNKPRTAGCIWQHEGATLSARGELLYCAVESKVLGSAIYSDPEKLFFANKDHLVDIINNKCDVCLHDYDGLPTVDILWRIYIDVITDHVRSFLPQNILDTSLYVSLRNIKRKNAYYKRKKKINKIGKSDDVSNFSPKLTNYKVLIIGWYGTETLGDKAILGGIVNALRLALKDFDIYLASLEPYISRMTIRQMPELATCSVLSIPDAIKLVSEMDLIVFGGGPIMATDPLAEMLVIFEHAHQANKPTLIAGCGVGPLGEKHLNQAIKRLLELATHRIYRDEQSMLLAQSLGIDVIDDQVAEDPAWTWLDAQMPKLKLPSHTKKDRLLLGLRNWPYREYAKELNFSEAEKLKTSFEREVVATLNLFVDQNPDLQIVPFPMSTNHIGQDDRWFYYRLFRNEPNLLKTIDKSYLRSEVSPLRAINVFRSVSVSLTMRFHSLLFSLATGTPTVSIDYTLGHGKVKFLAERYQVPQVSLDVVTKENLFPLLSNALVGKHSNTKKKDILTFNDKIKSFISSL